MSDDATLLARMVLLLDLKSHQGREATDLARKILGETISAGEALAKHYMIEEILRSSDMPKLEDLRKSLLTMTPDELRQRIREIRADRIIRKEAPRAKVNRVKTKDKTQMDLRQLLASMTDEERDAFLKELDA